MADFIYKIDTSEAINCNTLQLWCTSGIFGVNGSTTGFGAPMTDVSNIQSISLSVTSPSGTTTDFDVYALTSLSGFWFMYGGEYLEITPSMLDMATSGFEDGLYTFYSVIVLLDANDGVTTYTYTASKVKYLMCQHECIVNQMWDEATSLVNACDSCAKEKIELATEAQSYLTAARFAANCNMPNKAAEILDKIDNLDQFRNCSNCS